MKIDINGRYMVAYEEKMKSDEVLWNDETNNLSIIESVQMFGTAIRGKWGFDTRKFTHIETQNPLKQHFIGANTYIQQFGVARKLCKNI